MIMEDLEERASYCISWVDGSKKIKCVFHGKHRGFLIFVDENSMKVICRPSSIKEIAKNPA